MDFAAACSFFLRAVRMGVDNCEQKADESLSRTAAAAGVPSLPVLDHNVLTMPHAVEASPLTFLIDKTPH